MAIRLQATFPQLTQYAVLRSFFRTMLGVSTTLLIVIASFGCRSSRDLSQTPLGSDPSLVANYRFEGNSNDSKGSNNGTDLNIAYGASFGRFGQGASFNGSSSSIQVSSPTGLPVGNHDSTINAWFYPTTASEIGTCGISWGAEGNNQMAGIGLSPSGATALFWLGYSNDVWTPWTYSANAWYMITATYTATTRQVQFYINGLAQGAPQTLANTPNVGSTFLMMGKQRPSNPAYYQGSMDDVSIFSRVLTPKEISNLYGGGGTALTGKRTSETEGPTARPDTRLLSTTRAQQTLSRWSSGSITVNGIQDIPQDNTAKASIMFSSFRFKANTGFGTADRNYSGPGEAIFHPLQRWTVGTHQGFYLARFRHFLVGQLEHPRSIISWNQRRCTLTVARIALEVNAHPRGVNKESGIPWHTASTVETSLG
jgi:Concanavalin A-like lectin/glucanases superfamily